jgi:small ligand-binding sensory domain FIST
VRFDNGLFGCGLVCFRGSYGGDISCCGSVSMVVDLLRHFFLREQQAIAGDVILRLHIFRLCFQDAGMSSGNLLFRCLNRCFSILDAEDVNFNWLEVSTEDIGTSIFELFAEASEVSSVAWALAKATS